ncbi:MAG: imelysin family protein [Pseudomonadota bacterium]
MRLNAFVSLVLLTMCSGASAAPSVSQVLVHYADIAEAVYQDSLVSAKALKRSIEGFLASPTEENLAKARDAWRDARVPYQQSEAYRFANPIVDDWEGRVNAWPLDEGLIDYVAPAYGEDSDENPHYVANIVASTEVKVGGKVVDASTINAALLRDTLHELDGVEANVATGYHAIEFLLWGQDLNGAGPGAGERPATDFSLTECSGGHCERRRSYLQTASDLLIEDLEWIVGQWGTEGPARQAVTSKSDKAGMATIFQGLGSLSYGELAGERMKLGLMLHDPEEEHDCFSDNTHWSHFYDARGISNVYIGQYRRIDGTMVVGPSVSELVAARANDVDRKVRVALKETEARMQAIVDRAEQGEAYDQQISEANEAGNARVQAAIDALIGQTRAFEDAITALGLSAIAFEGSDSLDAPERVGE